jgi:predicted TIM-barrel fold metal-dependent hydrolase
MKRVINEHMNSFIDAHVHVQPWKMMKPGVIDLMRGSRKDMELVEAVMNSPTALLKYMDQQSILRVALINYVSPNIMGFTEEVNEFITGYCKADPERLISFGSILATQRTGQEKRIDELFGKLGLRGIKIHPPHQTIFANDYLNGNESLRYLYQKCEQEGIPVMFHTGTSIFQGARNRYADPIYIDDVAIDFPQMKIILAHGGRPLWMETSMFLVRRFPNVYMDISSIPPSKILEYFPRLEDLSDKVLFGSDWPAPMVKGMRENFDIFMQLPLTEGAKEKIGRLNAEKIF